MGIESRDYPRPDSKISVGSTYIHHCRPQTFDPYIKSMSGTLISSLVWVPRGRAALHPKKYTLDEDELERVGKLGGPGVLEKLRKEMEGLDVDGEGWEE